MINTNVTITPARLGLEAADKMFREAVKTMDDLNTDGIGSLYEDNLTEAEVGGAIEMIGDLADQVADLAAKIKALKAASYQRHLDPLKVSEPVQEIAA